MIKKLKYKTIYRDFKLKFNNMQYTDLIIPLPAVSKALSFQAIQPWHNIFFYPDQLQSSLGDPAKDITLTKVLHFAIGKPLAHHGKFAAERTAKSTLANYVKLSRAKHRGKKRSPASHKRMANNGIFTFPSVKASHGLPRFFSLLIN